MLPQLRNQRVNHNLALRTLHRKITPGDIRRYLHLNRIDQISLTTRILKNTLFIGTEREIPGHFAPQTGTRRAQTGRRSTLRHHRNPLQPNDPTPYSAAKTPENPHA